MLAEGDWRLADARRYVERALALQPGNREALLRSARIALAQDETRRATQLFDRLLGSSRPDWVHVVAAQERARIALAQDQGAAAVALLERAAALVPQEPSLWAALAFARHSAGARAGALDAAALATGAQRAFPAAPRHRYLETPTALLIGSRAEVEAGALLRLDTLATALASEEASRA